MRLRSVAARAARGGRRPRTSREKAVAFDDGLDLLDAALAPASLRSMISTFQRRLSA
jgi:hypothetical protein